MGKGASYWGNENGENTECDNKSGRPDCYPGKQGGDVKDKTEVPMEYGTKC